MSIHQELLPDEASLADSSRMSLLALAGNPLWEWQTLHIATVPPPHGWSTCGATSSAGPTSSPACFTNTETPYRRGSGRGNTSCRASVLCGSTFAPPPPSYSPMGSFSWNMGGKQNSHILLMNGACVCESSRVLRVGEKGISLPNYGLTACKSWCSWCEGSSRSSNLSQNHMGIDFLLLCCISVYMSPSTPKWF